MTASISRRAFIQWLPEAPSEPTSTLVLTSPAGRFVDIRILKQALVDRDPSKLLEDSELDWAFAGHSHTRQLDERRPEVLHEEDLAAYQAFSPSSVVSTNGSEADKPSHTVWKHTIDSGTEHAEEVNDEGDMQYHATLGLTLETGQMPRPGSGQINEYVEGWLDEAVTETKGMPSCVVFEMEQPEAQARGIMIKLGPYMQGVARLGNHFSLVRLKWTDEKQWVVEALMGHMAIPYHLTLHHGLSVGDTFDIRTSFSAVWQWRITEIG